MSGVLSKASVFAIQENSGLGRTLRLRTRALPYRPFELAGEMRHSVTWYPGSPVATIQVLGSSLSPTTINGVWKDRFIKNPASVDITDPDLARVAQGFIPPATLDNVPVGSAEALAELANDFKNQGQEVTVTWGSTVRVGIISKFVARFDREQDVAWEMEFVWSSEGQAPGPAAFVLEVDHSDILSQMTRRVDDLADNALSAFEVVQEFLATTNSKISEMQSAVQGLADNAAAVADTVTAPVDAARRAGSLLEFMVATAEETAELARDTVNVEIEVVEDPASVGVGRKVLLESYARGIQRGARDVASQAARNREAILARVDSPDLLGSFVARDGVDLRDISSRYYGTPGEWRQLAAFNNLSSSQVPAGTIIYVPQLALRHR